MENQLAKLFSRRLGGPVGAHARLEGIWFNPVFWVTTLAGLTWTLMVLRQESCPLPQDLVTVKAKCYSDLPVRFGLNGFFHGATPFQDYSPSQPILAVLVATGIRQLTWFFTFRPNSAASLETQQQLGQVFFAICSVVLFVAFICLVLTHLFLGQKSQSVQQKNLRIPSWDAALIAVSPVVFTTGLISWDLLCVALVSLGLLFWAKSQIVSSAVFFGLALGVRAYPLTLIFGLVLLGLRAGRGKHLAGWLATIGLVGAGIHLPIIISAPKMWFRSWQADNQLGSIWYVLRLADMSPSHPQFWSGLLIVLSLAGVGMLVFSVPKRPRIGTLGYLCVFPLTFFGTNYTPQMGLWLLPLVVLAVPNWKNWAVFSFGELFYWLVIWDHLSGSFSLSGDFSSTIYPIAVIFRLATQLWIGLVAIKHATSCWEDPVRSGFVDDPIGGVLDHRPDIVAPIGKMGSGVFKLLPGSTKVNKITEEAHLGDPTQKTARRVVR